MLIDIVLKLGSGEEKSVENLWNPNDHIQSELKGMVGELIYEVP